MNAAHVPNTPLHLTVEDVAHYLRTDHAAITSWLESGYVPGYQLPDRWLITADDRRTLDGRRNDAQRMTGPSRRRGLATRGRILVREGSCRPGRCAACGTCSGPRGDGRSGKDAHKAALPRLSGAVVSGASRTIAENTSRNGRMSPSRAKRDAKSLTFPGTSVESTRRADCAANADTKARCTLPLP